MYLFAMRAIRRILSGQSVGTDMATAWKLSSFILSEGLYFHMITNKIEVHTFLVHKLIWLSVNEILLLRYLNCSTYFSSLLLKVEMVTSKQSSCYKQESYKVTVLDCDLKIPLTSVDAAVEVKLWLNENNKICMGGMQDGDLTWMSWVII